MLTQELLKRLISYDPETGLLVWRARTPDLFKSGSGRYTAERACKIWNIRYAGTQAGAMSDGYIIVSIFKRRYKAHRLAVFYMTGLWPANDVDHENLDRAANDWNNLRDATRSENNTNSTAQKHNKLGVKGVCQLKNGRYYVQIRKDGKTYYLGCFVKIEDAIARHTTAALELHGKFARVN